MREKADEKLGPVGLILDISEWLKVRKVGLELGRSGSELVREFIRDGLAKLQNEHKKVA